MYIARLKLVNFRSYADTEVVFGPGLNVIVGANASGKTNLLEGAFFALRATSCRTNREEKVVRWGAGFARAAAAVAGAPPLASIEVGYAPGQGKRVRLDGADVEKLEGLRRRAQVFIFVPESLLLVKGSPARRRAHLDAFAAALDRGYEAALTDYNACLKQRNAQLVAVRAGADGATLEPWNRQLAATGVALEDRRRALVAHLQGRFAPVAAGLAPEGGTFGLGLVSPLDDLSADESDAGERAQRYMAALRARRWRDTQRGQTSLGPHRDDIVFAEETPAAALRPAAGETVAADSADVVTPLAGARESSPPGRRRDLRLFGSQGEQRAAVLALLLAERALARELTGDLGTLLLDDVMSELDDPRRRLLVRTLLREGQAIITTTNLHYFTPEELDRATVIELPLAEAIEGEGGEAAREQSGEEGRRDAARATPAPAPAPSPAPNPFPGESACA